MEEKNAQNDHIDQSPEVNESPSVPEETLDMETLLAQEGLGLENLPQKGDIRKGIITFIQSHEILIDIKAKSDGVISGREFESIPKEALEELQVGNEIKVYVVNAEDPNGNVVLSYTRAKKEEDWERVNELLESKDTITTKIEGFNKGGLLVPVGQLNGFIPGSLISVFREEPGDTPEERWGHLLGEEITLKVIEVERDRRRLVLSERDAIGETREAIKGKLLEELEIGSIVSGYVSSIAKFGAFVNIRGIDGLIHLSELSWEHINHPSEIVKKGQEVEVKIINVDKESRRIGLSLRALQDDPWLGKMQDIVEGQLVQGTITNITNFGAFARIENTDLEGLIHISELSMQRIGHPKEVVNSGDAMTLRVIKIDKDRHRIGLSLEKVDDPRYASLDFQMLKAELEEEKGPPAESAEPPTESVEPPTESVEPPAESAEPPAESEEPPTESAEPPAESVEPPAESEEPPAESEEPPAESEELPAESEEPPVESEEPPAESEEPPVESEEPPAESEEPPAETES